MPMMPYGGGLNSALQPQGQGLLARLLGGGAPTGQPMGGGLGQRLQDLLNPQVALPMAGALMGGRTFQSGMGDAMTMGGMGLGKLNETRKTEAEKNKTMAFLRASHPELADMVAAGMPIKDAWDAVNGDGDATNDIKNFQYAKRDGFKGSFMDWQNTQKPAGTQNNITVGGGKYGTIPPGYELVDGPNGSTMRQIPGGPEDTSKKDMKAAGQADVATRIVTTAASRAREAAKNRALGGFGQGLTEKMPWTDSAEVARQTDVLKSTAKIENLTAMRAASPTGGALGSVTEKEADMLAAKSGALDPSSPTFERDLDDYELTLLQVVHGPQEGARIFAETREGGIPVPPQAQTGGWTVKKLSP